MGACPACGEPRTGDSSFCAACGSRLDPIAPARDEPPQPAAAAPAPPPATGPVPTFAPPSTPPTAPPPPPLVLHEGSSGPDPKVLAGVAVLVVALVVAAFVVLGSGGDDDGGASAGDPATTTIVPLVTSPQLTDEEYLVDVLAANRGSSPLAAEAEDACFFQSMIAAMGGAAGLREARIPPEQLSDTFPLRGEAVPADAVDVFLATNAACGLDLTEVIFVRPVSIALGDAVASCVSANIDRAGLNPLIAAFFLDPNRSDFSFVAPGDLVNRTESLVDGCV